jgi:outer membrane receptor for ferrienterochelin and colicin
MTGTELLKAACCNLSESFETNPSVDVSYNDAVTGSKQIQLLGLSGNYTQLTVENLPGPRGLATSLGLNSIAGPWIEGIQLTKGTGSVANGFESIAGQINVELKKPETAEKLLGNIYVNDQGKTDLNLNLTTKLNQKWSSALLLHDNFMNNALDMNKDGFKDLPTGNTFSMVNRYKYDNSNGLLGQFGVKVLNDQKLGGQIAFDERKDKFTENYYGLGINTQRYELFGKLGYVFPQQKYKSIGLQLSATNFQQASYFGITSYDAKQQSFYSNLIYQSIINSTIHKFRTGLSFQYDKYNENYNFLNFKRNEIVPGGFFEYTYTPNDKWSMVAGLRADDNNIYGTFFTPRLNIRYEPITGTVFRFSAGRGQRTANIFAENNSLMVSQRRFLIPMPQQNNYAYYLQPEISWNKGISLDQKLNLFGNPASISLDYFRNDFLNQVIVDLETATKVEIYNLNGKSYSNSLQAELNVTPLDKLDLRVAYRYFDVKQTYNGVLLDRPFIAKHRAFFSLDYATSNDWKFNYTVTFNGKKRIVNPYESYISFIPPSSSPTYFLMNAQISKSIDQSSPMDFYVGVENIGNFFQKNTIILPNDPFSRGFDASYVWGPVTGRMLYVGWRIKIK